MLDKEALAEKRLQQREDTHRHSSVDVTDIDHIVVGGEDYAIIKKSPKANKKLNKELSSLISPSVASRSLADALNQPGKELSVEEARSGNGLKAMNSPSREKTPKKKLSSVSQSSNDSGGDGLDYAVVDVSVKKKKSAELSRSPKPGRKNQDSRQLTTSSSPKTSAGHDATDNGVNYTTVAMQSRKKLGNLTLAAPSQDGELQVRSESPELRRGVVKNDDKSGDTQQRKIEYSTVVFSNSFSTTNSDEKNEIRDFDKTKFNYSTVVFKGLDSHGTQHQNDILKTSQQGESSSKGAPVKKSIYDSDGEDEVVDEPPYVNIRRDGRPINTMNVPPMVPPRRGAAAITDDSN